MEDEEPITAVQLMPRHDDENDEKGVLMTSCLRRQRKVMISPWSVDQLLCETVVAHLTVWCFCLPQQLCLRVADSFFAVKNE